MDRSRTGAAVALLLALSGVFAAVPGSEGWSGAAARGDRLAAEHRLLSAAGAYEDAALRPGGDPSALVRLGGVYLRREQAAEAVRVFRTAEAGGAAAREVMMGLATAQDSAGDVPGSLATLRRELQARTDDGDAWLRLVQRAAETGARRAQIRERLVGLPRPTFPPALSQMASYLEGSCLLDPESEAGLGLLRRASAGPDPRIAAEARDLLEATAEKDADARGLAIARALLAQGLLGPALDHLEPAGPGPGAPEREALTGYVLMRTGQPEMAEEALSRSQELAPDLPIGQFMMGSFLRQKGEAEAAERLLVKAARGQPSNPAILVELAGALVGVGDYGSAEQALSAAVQAAPESGDLRLAVASFYVDRQYRIEKALPEAEDAVRMLGRSAPSLSALGWALHLSGRSQEALGPMSEAVARDPEAPVFRYRLGAIFEGLGRRQEARAQYLMVGELDGGGDYRSRALAALDGM